MTTSDAPTLHLLLVTNDLLFASQAAGVLQQCGGRMHEASGSADAISLCQNEPIGLVLVDLTAPGLNPQEFVGSLRSELHAAPPLLAFGPHVRAGLLSSARAAGFDQVLTRGQVHSELAAIVREYTARGPTNIQEQD